MLYLKNKTVFIIMPRSSSNPFGFPHHLLEKVKISFYFSLPPLSCFLLSGESKTRGGLRFLRSKQKVCNALQIKPHANPSPLPVGQEAGGGVTRLGSKFIGKENFPLLRKRGPILRRSNSFLFQRILPMARNKVLVQNKNEKITLSPYLKKKSSFLKMAFPIACTASGTQIPNLFLPLKKKGQYERSSSLSLKKKKGDTNPPFFF